MLYCIEELRVTLWFILENWVFRIDNKRVLREEEANIDFIEKMKR
jgi:hypothetical protein